MDALTRDNGRLFFVLGCFFAFLAVALGAFAAHALKSRIAPDLLAIFEVGVRYHMYHALALFVVAFAFARWPGVTFSVPGILFTAGIALFSGSLYVLSLTGLRWLGAITPVGGLCFLLGWFFLAIKVWQAR